MNITRRKSSGFTLVEVAVVVFITGILVAISAISFDLVNSSTLSTRNRASAEQVKKISEIYHSETGSYPGMIQEFYTGGTLAKIPIEASVIADAASSPLNFNTGNNTLAYACLNSCVNSVTGGRLGYWDYTAKNIKYIYIGDATAASSWDYPQNINSIMSGGNSICGITNLSNLYCWGSSAYGQLGNSGAGEAYATTPIAVDTNGIMINKNIKEVGSGTLYGCALDTKGVVYCWGNSGDGQVGNGALGSYFSPQKISMDGALNGLSVKTITTGGYHACTIASDNNAYCWGNSGNGRLGVNLAVNSPQAVAVSRSGVFSDKSVLAISAGQWHTCAIASDNNGYCWGASNYGQIGDSYNSSRYEPTAVVANSGALIGKKLLSISSGYGHTCAVADNHQVYCWGYNSRGQLGDGGTTNSTIPVEVRIDGALNGKTMTSVSAGYNHTCATDSDGKAYCWGWDGGGELGIFVSGNISLVPVAIDMSGVLSGKRVISTTTSTNISCFITEDGIIACSGVNYEGLLGNPSIALNSFPPVLVDTNGALKGLTVKSASVNTGGNICAVASNNRAYCWGSNGRGQLGNGLNPNKPLPTRTNGGALAGKTIKKVDIASDHACAIASDNLAYCWGRNTSGQLGNGSTTNSLLPVPVNTSGLLNGKTIRDISLDFASTCVITNDNIGYCWGYNAYGALGNGLTARSTTPYAINTDVALIGRTLKSLASSNNTFCAIADNDKAFCWGSGANGQLGNGTTSNSLVPVAVDDTGVLGGRPILSLSGGNNSMCAVANDKRAYCWGDQSYGAIGNGSASGSATRPTAVNISGVMANKDIIEVGVGAYFGCALSDDSKIFCWGLNSAGQLGNGTYTNSSVPVEVDTTKALKNKQIKSISVNQQSVCAVTTNNEVYCWGDNSYSEFGNNAMDSSNTPTKTFM